MDYSAAIERIYDHVGNDRVDNAVMDCLRVARNLQDFLFAAILLREMHPGRREFLRVLYDDVKHLKPETLEFIDKRSLEYWLETHTLDFPIVGKDDDGHERNILAVGVGEIASEIDQYERSIHDMKLPPGLGEYDTAAFFDENRRHIAGLRLRIRAFQAVRQRIKTRCFNYAVGIERQLAQQVKVTSFLDQVQTQVTNYFKAHSEDTYNKLQRASSLVGSSSQEDQALLLTEIRRSLKAAADHFLPASPHPVRCADGVDRVLKEDQYLNRLQHFLRTHLEKSASREILTAEFELLATVMRRLNELASKGVHGNVSTEEAKQGLVGLYLFLYNLVTHLEKAESVAS
jgi:hypothetical protein